MEAFQQFYTLRELAKIIRKHPEVVRRMVVENRGPRFYRLGKNIRIMHSDLESWVKECAAP